MEIEVKARIDDIGNIKNKLAAMGAVFNSSVVQHDMYFKHNTFDRNNQGPGDVIVRIRRCGGKAELTTKTLTEILGAWEEHETGIENPAEMEKILLLSGFINVFDINKIRTLGNLGDFEICLDDTKELGKYIEVSIISDEKEKTREKIINFLRGLGINESMIEKRGYGEIIGEKLGHKFGGMR